MISNTQSKDNRILTDAELNDVSGGVRTNGENPFVRMVMDTSVAVLNFAGFYYGGVRETPICC